MTEQTEHIQPTTAETKHDEDKLAAVKVWALRQLDTRRQDELDELFHVDPSFAHDNPEKAARLKAKFLREKKDLAEAIRATGREPNIGDMFNLALKYFGLIGVVKLAETDHDKSDESLRLKHEFENHIHWLETKGVDTEKLHRKESGRWFSVDIVGNEDDGPDGFRAVIHRVRPLLHTEISLFGDDELDEPAQLTIIKETVFSLPAGVFGEIMSQINARGASAGPDGYAWSEYQKQLLEERLYGTRDNDELQRINTAYFSALVPLSAQDALLHGDDTV